VSSSSASAPDACARSSIVSWMGPTLCTPRQSARTWFDIISSVSVCSVMPGVDADSTKLMYGVYDKRSNQSNQVIKVIK
jgi:hypothetical protein